MHRLLKGLAAALAVITGAWFVAPAPAAATPTAWVQLHKGKGGGPQAPPSPPPADQTAYFGPLTLDGGGGFDPCQARCVGTVTGASTANYRFDTTQRQGPGSPGLLVPSSDGTHTYNKARVTPLSGTEDFTGCDSLSRCFTVHLVADRTHGGDYTIRWRKGDSFSSTTGTNQLFQVWSKALPSQRIVWRDRTCGFNTVACAGIGETVYAGGAQARISCNIGTCTSQNWFDGTNWITLEPELGGTAIFGPISIEGLYGLHIKNITFGGADFSKCWQASGCPYYINGVASAGSKNIWIDAVTMVGNANEDCFTTASTCGKQTVGGIFQGNLSSGWKVTDSSFSWLYNGINFAQKPGSYPADLNGTAPAADANGNPLTYDIERNTFANMRADVIDVGCIHHTTIKDNVVYDRKASITVGSATTNPPYTNPFDSAHQKHADFSQFDCPAGVYQFYPGVDIENNYYLRGIGTDTVPYFTVAQGFPNPDNYTTAPCYLATPPTCSNANIPTGAYVPDPTVGVSTGQGLYWSNWAGNSGHKFNGTNIVRTYNLVLDGLVMTDNVIFSDLVRGISLGPIANSTVTGNTAITAHVAGSAANLNNQGSGWNFGKTQILIEGSITNSTVERNVSGNTPTFAGAVGLNAGNIGNNNLAASYQNPGAYGSPRSAAEFKAGFLPIAGGSLELDHVAHIYAGFWCPDGSRVDATGHCPY
jgi:hypothetical protein